MSEKITDGLAALEGLVKSGGKAASAEEQAAIREGLDELSKLAKKNPELQGTLDELVGAASKVNAPTKLAFKTGAEGEAHLAKRYPGGQSQVKFETGSAGEHRGSGTSINWPMASLTNRRSATRSWATSRQSRLPRTPG